MRLFILILINFPFAYSESIYINQLCGKKEDCKNFEKYKMLNPKLKPSDELNSIYYEAFDALEMNNSQRANRKPIEQAAPEPIKPIGSGSESNIP